VQLKQNAQTKTNITAINISQIKEICQKSPLTDMRLDDRYKSIPKRWWSPITDGQNTTLTATPPRLATWTGRRSPIRFGVTREQICFASLCRSRAVRCPIGGSMLARPSRRCHCRWSWSRSFSRYALSLTGRSQVGETTRPLRANPSSGNLCPTEGYAVLPACVQFRGRVMSITATAPAI